MGLPFMSRVRQILTLERIYLFVKMNLKWFVQKFGVYGHPDTEAQEFVNRLDNLLQKLGKTNKKKQKENPHLSHE